MRDFIGQELEVGDLVAVTVPNYRSLMKATVARFTPKRVVLQYFERSTLHEYTTPPNFVIKIPKKGDSNV
jgi:hypothetical protein